MTSTLDKRDRVESGLSPTPIVIAGRPLETHLLFDQMAYYQVPGVSVAVIEQGDLVWAKGYGVTDVRTQQPMTAETLLYAASISKSVSALAALYLVERGDLDLDEDVNTKLTTWQVPDNAYTQTEKVTLRRILSHISGLDAGTYYGYPPEGPKPTLLQLLRGEAPSNSGAVQVKFVPGSQYEYSGVGYWVLQQLLEDVTGQPAADFIQTTVLDRLGMARSSFQQPLPPMLQNAIAMSHNEAGEAIFDNYAHHPGLPDGALWTTPTDLARFAIGIYRAYQGQVPAILSPELVHEMLTEQTNYSGLGVDLLGAGQAFRFSKGGEGEGTVCEMKMFVETGQGAVVMTNSRNSYPIIGELYRSIATIYEWPALQQTHKTIVELPSDRFDAYEGTYQAVMDEVLLGQYIFYTGFWQVGDGREVIYQVTKTMDDEGQPCLCIQYPVMFAHTYYAKSMYTFFTTAEETEIRFVEDEAGVIDRIEIQLDPALVIGAERKR